MIELIIYQLRDDDVSKSHIILKGIIGSGAPMLGVAVGFFDKVDPWLRFTSMCVGILVGFVTLISLILTIRIKIFEVKKAKEKSHGRRN